MAVELSLDRKCVEITWASDVIKGKKVDIRCTNPDNEDVSTRRTENDGRAVLTFPKDYQGDVFVTVSGMGNSEDTGTISID